MFDAPRELVFAMWTRPEHVQRWWGPNGFTSASCKIDVRVGGTFLFCMRSPEGRDYWTKGVYREIAAPERLVYVDSFADAEGHTVAPAHYGLGPEYPAETLVTVTFEERAGRTRMTLRHAGIPSGEPGAVAAAGWAQSLERMAEHVQALPASEREIAATRLFEAPRALVFSMWTDSAHITHWWGPRGFRTTTHAMEFRPGGVWRFTMHGPDGRDYANKIVYVEIVEPERIVYDHVSGPRFHASATFADEGGWTRLTVRMLFESAELRNRVVDEFGVAEGLQQTLTRLAEHLQSGAQDQAAW